MKKIFVIITLLLISVISFGQAPEKINYQTVIRDSGNHLLANQLVGVQISILQTSSTGTSFYTETQTPTTNVNGLVTLVIGTGTVVSGNFTTIDWSLGPYFIKTEYDLTGGTNHTVSEISQILSVPYVLEAKNGIPTGGTNGQILRINSSGNAEWVTPLYVSTFYADTDGDGYGDINSSYVADNTMEHTGYVRNNTDCNDSDASVNPNTVWYLDSDNDGYAALKVIQCISPGVGYTAIVLPLGDCNDNDLIINPGTRELAQDGIDNNCDGRIDEGYVGQVHSDGIVFWVDPTDNTHGLVVAFSGSSSVLWGCKGTDLPNVSNVAFYLNNPTGSGAEIGDGYTNTNNILTDCTDYYGMAAYYAREKGPQWFLPSIKELAEIYKNKAALEAVSLFVEMKGFFWSSSEYNADYAFGYEFKNLGYPTYKDYGNSTVKDKSKAYDYGSFSLRTVRAF